MIYLTVFFKSALMHLLGTWNFFFKSLIIYLSDHTFLFGLFFLSQTVWVWGGDICAALGHLLFVVIADFGMPPLELLPVLSVHIQCFIN